MEQEEQWGRHVSSPRPCGLRVPGTLEALGSLVPVLSPEWLVKVSGFSGKLGLFPGGLRPALSPGTEAGSQVLPGKASGNSNPHLPHPESIADGLVSEVGDLATPCLLPPGEPWSLPPPVCAAWVFPCV